MKWLVVVLCVATATVLEAQNLAILYSFSGSSTDGAHPLGSLFQATDGNFYGNTEYGGARDSGTVFRITPSGAWTMLDSLACPPCGYTPGQIIEANGDLYGTAEFGGGLPSSLCWGGCGMVFKIAPGGAVTTVYSFCSSNDCTDGMQPLGGLVQGAAGDLYGTTQGGGTSTFGFGGTIFRLTPSGALTTIYNFCLQSGCPDGELPSAALVQAADGDFYGTTTNGGAPGFCPPQNGPQGCGTVFRVTPTGTLTTLYSFCSQSGCIDGSLPTAGLVQAINGDFYGTTPSGGASNNGTVFRITPTGTFTTLYSFCAQSPCTDGALPASGLIQASDGELYGTTQGGGTHGIGTIFKITTDGTLTTVLNFNGTNGSRPGGGLVQAMNGDFYGTTQIGGADNHGIVFRLSVGLPPFVKTVPRLGSAGSSVTILGTDLTGASSIRFNGVPAAFSMVSATEITAIVPAGATSGRILVVTPGGTLTSNVPFAVLP